MSIIAGFCLFIRVDRPVCKHAGFISAAIGSLAQIGCSLKRYVGVIVNIERGDRFVLEHQCEVFIVDKGVVLDRVVDIDDPVCPVIDAVDRVFL